MLPIHPDLTAATDYGTCVALGARVGLGPSHRVQGSVGERRPCERCGTIIYIGPYGRFTEDRAAKAATSDPLPQAQGVGR